MNILIIIFVIFLGYLIGSFPSAYIIGKIFSRKDIRKLGSGNIGATNVLRVFGILPGLITLLLDMGKGFIVVWMVREFLLSAPDIFQMNRATFFLPLGTGLAAIIGHNWTLFLKFKGGKGMATTLGVCLALFPKVAGYVILVWLGVVLLIRYVSIASLVSALSLPFFIWVYFRGAESSVIFMNVAFGLILAFLVFWRHQSNIQRLIHHQERKLSFSKNE